MNACVYILRDDNGKHYIGSTNDLVRRLKQHSRGDTQTTRNMANPRLVLKQEVESLLEARRLEYKLKKMKRKDYLEKMISDGYIRIAK